MVFYHNFCFWITNFIDITRWSKQKLLMRAFVGNFSYCRPAWDFRKLVSRFTWLSQSSSLKWQNQNENAFCVSAEEIEEEKTPKHVFRWFQFWWVQFLWFQFWWVQFRTKVIVHENSGNLYHWDMVENSFLSIVFWLEGNQERIWSNNYEEWGAATIYARKVIFAIKIEILL